VLQGELDGGRYQDQAARVIDTIADAKGLARSAESDILP
jgi:hypothetical protein